jgi:hypothetical protein
MTDTTSDTIVAVNPDEVHNWIVCDIYTNTETNRAWYYNLSNQEAIDLFNGLLPFENVHSSVLFRVDGPATYTVVSNKTRKLNDALAAEEADREFGNMYPLIYEAIDHVGEILIEEGELVAMISLAAERAKLIRTILG